MVAQLIQTIQNALTVVAVVTATLNSYIFFGYSNLKNIASQSLNPVTTSAEPKPSRFLPEIRFLEFHEIYTNYPHNQTQTC